MKSPRQRRALNKCQQRPPQTSPSSPLGRLHHLAFALAASRRNQLLSHRITCGENFLTVVVVVDSSLFSLEWCTAATRRGPDTASQPDETHARTHAQASVVCSASEETLASYSPPSSIGLRKETGASERGGTRAHGPYARPRRHRSSLADGRTTTAGAAAITSCCCVQPAAAK
jgi:hypothetical protein